MNRLIMAPITIACNMLKRPNGRVKVFDSNKEEHIVLVNDFTSGLDNTGLMTQKAMKNTS